MAMVFYVMVGMAMVFYGDGGYSDGGCDDGGYGDGSYDYYVKFYFRSTMLLVMERLLSFQALTCHQDDL